MKHLIYGLGLLTLLVLVSCNGKPDRPDSVLNESQQNYSGTDLNAPGANAAVTPQAPPVEPPQNAEGVWHYTCPDGHPGGSGSATACAQCGKTLVHNQAYHNNGNQPTPPVTQQITRPGEVTPGSTITFDPSNPGSATASGTNLTTPPPPTPEPAQNAAGVWHYTCSDGHPGGAGSATPCAQCGKTLVHNQAYHQ